MKRDGDLEPEPGSWPSLSGVTVPVPAVSFSPELVDGFRPWLHHLLLAMIGEICKRTVGSNDATKATSNEEGFGSKPMPNWLVCSIHRTTFSLVMFV